MRRQEKVLLSFLLVGLLGGLAGLRVFSAFSERAIADPVDRLTGCERVVFR